MKSRAKIFFALALLTLALSAALIIRIWNNQAAFDEEISEKTIVSGFVNQNPACRKAYGLLYAKEKVRFTVVFGYKDARPARFVGDAYEESAFVQRMLKFGFARDAQDEKLFRIKLKHQDGQTIELELTVLQSAVSPDDQENRLNPYQRFKSRQSEASFLQALQTSDAVFYNGHSRDGGGPDFEPPLLIGEENHVNYAWYRAHELGIQKVMQALRAAQHHPQLIGLFSCSSEGHFAGAVERLSHSALITSRSLLYYSDALKGLSETIENLIQQKCQPDFHPVGTQLRKFFD